LVTYYIDALIRMHSTSKGFASSTSKGFASSTSKGFASSTSKGFASASSFSLSEPNWIHSQGLLVRMHFTGKDAPYW